MKYFPTSVYEITNLSDLYLYNRFHDPDSLKRSEFLYCLTFETLPIPSFYNDLRNLAKITNKYPEELCLKNNKLISYDKYKLIPDNFY